MAGPILGPHPDLTAHAPLDGELSEGRSVSWIATAGRVAPSEDPTRVSWDAPPGASLEARLMLGDRVLATARTQLPPERSAPLGVVIGDRVIVRADAPLEWAGDVPALLEQANGLAVFDLPGASTFAVRAAHADGPSPWTWMTAGTLPEPSGGVEVPLDPRGCADPEFPRRSGRVHLGCSELGRVDRVVLPGRAVAHPLPPAARVPADRAADAAGDLIWAADAVGRWSGEVVEHPLHTGGFRGRPAGDRQRMVFARTDRVEVKDRDRPGRSQLPAQPLDGPANVAVAGSRIAILEGSRGALRLRLHDLERHAGAVVASGADLRRPRLAGDHVGVVDDGRPRLIPLRGGVAAKYDVPVAADAADAVLDDFWLVQRRPGGPSLEAIHLPTGLSGDWGTGREALRGAGAGAMTWATGGRLETGAAAVRVFEEDGVASSGHPAGAAQSGGHGGRSLRLASGEGHRMLLPDPGEARVSLFRSAASGTGEVTVVRGSATLTVVLGVPSEAGWTEIPAPPGAADVELRFEAGPDGLTVDAARLVAAPGAT